MEHSLMGPSSLERRMLCPGSYHQEVQLPPDQEASFPELAAQNTELHEMIGQVILSNMTTEDALEAAGDHSGAVLSCLRYAQVMIERNPHALVNVEHRVDCGGMHHSVQRGTADLVLVEAFHRAIVVDWKLGYRQPAPAESNLQLAAYAVAVSDEFETPEVAIAVVMGRMGRVSQALLGPDQLDDARERINGIAERASNPMAPLRPSADACRYCKAKATCPALAEVTFQALESGADVEGWTPVQLAQLLGVAYMAAEWAGAVKSEAYKRLSMGGQVPGYQLVEGNRRKSWKDDVTVEQLEELAEELKKDKDAILSPRKLASPAAVGKAWGRAKKTQAALEELIDTRRDRARLETTTREE